MPGTPWRGRQPVCPAQVNAQWGVDTCVWQRSWDGASRLVGAQGTGSSRPLQSGCTSVLSAVEPRQGPGWELGQDLRRPLISRSGCLGPSVLTRSTGGGQARLDWVVAGSPRRKLSQGRALEGPEEWSLRTLTAGRDLLSKTKGHLQRAAVSGIPQETRAKRPGDGPGQERPGHRRTDRRMGLRERQKVGGRGVPRCSPSPAPSCPSPGTPGEDKCQGFRVVGMPTQGTVSGWSLWSPSLSPDPTGLSPAQPQG